MIRRTQKGIATSSMQHVLKRNLKNVEYANGREKKTFGDVAVNREMQKFEMRCVSIFK